MRDINNNLKSNFESSINIINIINIIKKSVAKSPKTVYDGEMRKVFVFFLLSLSLLFIKIPISSTAQEPPTCKVTVTPTGGVAGETVFSISGNVTNLPSNATDIILNIVDTDKKNTILFLPLAVTLVDNNTGSFGPTAFGPFFSSGKYTARISYTITTRGTIDRLLCFSDNFIVTQPPTPIPQECSPPGRDPKNQGKCLDTRCTPTGRYQCLLNTVEIADTPTPTPESPSLNCLKGLDKDGNLTTNAKQIVICKVVDTAVGEISVEPFEFVKSIMGTLLGLAGGIAVVLIIVAGYRRMASQGNPEAAQAAREQITSAIVGLLFIIFSLVILQTIGVDILRIPGFGG